MKIIENKENKLLSRKEIVALFSDVKSTLTKKEIKTQVAKELKIEEDLIIINKVKNHFGKREFEVLINIYKNKKEMETIISKHIAKRNENPKEKEAKK